MSSPRLVMGAVAYDPKVVTIWEGFRQWLRPRGLDFDFVLYSNYERQVTDLLAGHIDAAWNSPLAWVRATRLAAASGAVVTAMAMRDTDRDLTSVIVVRTDSPVQTIGDLNGRRVGSGAVDSPQATLLPLQLLRQAGVGCHLRRFDVGVGLHGDHIGGERDAARALMAGEVDAACMIDSNHLSFTREGTLPPGGTRIVGQTPPFDHCNMTIVDSAPHDAVARFNELLHSMDFGDPAVRILLELEGLRKWVPGRVSGYRQLEQAVDGAQFYDAKGVITAADYAP